MATLKEFLEKVGINIDGVTVTEEESNTANPQINSQTDNSKVDNSTVETDFQSAFKQFISNEKKLEELPPEVQKVIRDGAEALSKNQKEQNLNNALQVPTSNPDNSVEKLIHDLCASKERSNYGN